jgi:hemolysin activation/secretion protein
VHRCRHGHQHHYRSDQLSVSNPANPEPESAGHKAGAFFCTSVTIQPGHHRPAFADPHSFVQYGRNRRTRSQLLDTAINNRRRRKNDSLSALAGIVFATITSAAQAGEPGDTGCEPLHGLSDDALQAYRFDSPAVDFDLPDQTFKVGEVRFIRQQIFNTALPEEDRWLFRVANFLHTGTNEAPIRHTLTFDEGDRIGRRHLEESERQLRSMPYMYDARVLPREICGDTLHLDVITRDVWTLNPRANVSRSGGENRFGFGVSDPNILGTGKTLSMGFESDEDRRGTTFYYRDPNLFGSRWQLRLQASDNDDGAVTALELQRPFYALDTPYSLGFRVDRNRYDDAVFELRDTIGEFRRDSRSARILGGRALPASNDKPDSVRRIEVGWHFQEEQFRPIAGEPLPDPFPPDRRRVFPWLGFEHVVETYETTFNVDRIQRTEDLFLGQQTRVELGFAHTAWGADDRRALLSLWHSRNRIIAAADPKDPIGRHMLGWEAELHGEWNFERQRAEAVDVTSRVDYHWRHSRRWGFHATVQGAYQRRPFPENQILLGGDTGLRGYPNRYQPGDRALLLTLEERYYSTLNPLQLFHLGAALFVDVGRAWFPGSPHSTEQESGTLSNVGFGLRLESTRTRRDRVAHLDISYPLRETPGSRGTQITLSGRQSL